MKIVVLPGVGFHDQTDKYDKFLSDITKELDCEGEIFKWKHDWPLPYVELPYVDLRKWIFEVILDFQQVTKHAFEMEIPKADYYIGHSAGSIIALAQKDIPCVIFGSPAILIESIGDEDARYENNICIKLLDALGGSDRSVLNIVNKYDQLAHPLYYPTIENYIYRGSFFNLSSFNPISAHIDYWTNKKIKKKIINTIKLWKNSV